MNISYSQTQRITCFSCHRQFDGVFWLIIDAEERPDLWDRYSDREIHFVDCPEGHGVLYNVPLLAHDGLLKLLRFYPSYDFTEEKNDEALLWLHAHLLDSLSTSKGGEAYLQLSEVEVCRPHSEWMMKDAIRKLNGEDL